MKRDVIISGVGGQGILSIAFVIDNAVLDKGWHFKQSEVHGMAQRGGVVQSHLRYSDTEILSDLIPNGSADVILSVEPLESLRYLDYLSPAGIAVISTAPYKNIPDYPDFEEVLKEIKKIKNHILIESETLAKEAGHLKAQNMVMLGAASKWLELDEATLKKFITMAFEKKGESVIQLNMKAFDLGKQAAAEYKV